MPRRPGYSGDLGQATGFEDYTGDWESFNEGGWPGAADMNPWDVPEAIGGDWSMNFRPGNVEGAYGEYQDWASGAGEEALPLDRFNDAQYIQAFGSVPDAPGPGADPAGLIGAGYGLDLYPGQTANQDWRLQYGISDPSGDQTGWALSGAAPYAGFPWNPGYSGESMVRTGDGGGGAGDGNIPSLGNQTAKNIPFDQTEIAGGTNDPRVGPQNEAQMDQLLALLSGLLPGRGDMADRESQMPLTPPSFADLTRKTWGQDALSQMQLSRMGHIMESGGLEETNLQRRADQALQHIIDQGGVGGENLSPLGLRTQDALHQIMAQGGQGAENLSPLGSTTADALEEIIGARGAGAAEAATPLGTDLQENLRQLMASGGQLPADTQRRAMEMETLRDPIEAFRQAQLAQGQATMADRGLLGQGPELDYMQRLEGELAPMYAGAGQQLALGEAERADTRYREAMQQSNLMAAEQARQREGRLGTALGEAGDLAGEQAQLREGRLQTALTTGEALTSAQAQRRENRLAEMMRLATQENQARTRAAIDANRAATEYRQFLTDSAFEDLDRSMEWNKFLFDAGMERAEALEMIETGRLQSLLAMVNAYMAGAQGLAGGFTGFPFLEEDK